jgi:hypothetical protein
MGDMADWIMEQSEVDLYEYQGQYDYEGVKCRYCGNRGFIWVETENGWRLMTPTGKLHRCKAYKKAKEVSR